MIAFLALTAIAFSLFGFIIGIWARNFEQLAVIPALVVTPLTFLGGAFLILIDMLPPFWRAVSLFNPVVLSSSAASAGASSAVAMSASPLASALRWCSSPRALGVLTWDLPAPDGGLKP